MVSSFFLLILVVPLNSIDVIDAGRASRTTQLWSSTTRYRTYRTNAARNEISDLSMHARKRATEPAHQQLPGTGTETGRTPNQRTRRKKPQGVRVVFSKETILIHNSPKNPLLPSMNLCYFMLRLNPLPDKQTT